MEGTFIRYDNKGSCFMSKNQNGESFSDLCLSGKKKKGHASFFFFFFFACEKNFLERMNNVNIKPLSQRSTSKGFDSELRSTFLLSLYGSHFIAFPFMVICERLLLDVQSGTLRQVEMSRLPDAYEISSFGIKCHEIVVLGGRDIYSSQ